MKELIVDVLECENKNYTVMTYTQVNFSTNPRPDNQGPVAGVGVRVGKLGKSEVSHGKGEGHIVHVGVNGVCNVCASAHSCGCVVNSTWEFLE